jgi:hypothetical protein
MGLTNEGRVGLESLLCREGYDGSVSSADRVMVSGGGHSTPEIALMAGTTKPTVYKWIARYEEYGIGGLSDWMSTGRPRGFHPRCGRGICGQDGTTWHQKPDLVPSAEMQQALDTTLERTGGANARFARNAAKMPSEGPTHAAEDATATTGMDDLTASASFAIMAGTDEDTANRGFMGWLQVAHAASAPPDGSDVGQIIRWYRTYEGLTQEDAAARLKHHAVAAVQAGEGHPGPARRHGTASHRKEARHPTGAAWRSAGPVGGRAPVRFARQRPAGPGPGQPGALVGHPAPAQRPPRDSGRAGRRAVSGAAAHPRNDSPHVGKLGTGRSG